MILALVTVVTEGACRTAMECNPIPESWLQNPPQYVDDGQLFFFNALGGGLLAFLPCDDLASRPTPQLSFAFAGPLLTSPSTPAAPYSALAGK